MTGQPPSGPLKYKVAPPEELPQPKRIQLPALKKPRVSHWEALFRVAIVLVILVSIAVAYWSFFQRLAPLQKESRSMLSKISVMSSQLDQLERRWTPKQASEIRERYREVYAHVFTDQAALEEWLAQVQAQAKALALDVNVGLGQGTAQEGLTTNSLAIIPASISLEVLPAPDPLQGKSPYERVLGFTQQLASHGKRADLAELTVTGGVGSVKRASLVFNLWAGDVAAEAPVAVATNTNTNTNTSHSANAR